MVGGVMRAVMRLRVAAGSTVIVLRGPVCRRAVASVRAGCSRCAMIMAGMRVRRRGRRAAVSVSRRMCILFLIVHVAVHVLVHLPVVTRMRIGGSVRAVIMAGMRVGRRGRRAAVVVRVGAGLTADRVVGFAPVADSACRTGAVGIERGAVFERSRGRGRIRRIGRPGGRGDGRCGQQHPDGKMEHGNLAKDGCIDFRLPWTDFGCQARTCLGGRSVPSVMKAGGGTRTGSGRRCVEKSGGSRSAEGISAPPMQQAAQALHACLPWEGVVAGS
ncbi:MAG: hypothetical protein RBS46_07285 [Methyloversatilis sp.]|nr:hypothetical protein [Methyloversatilis sp.]